LLTSSHITSALIFYFAIKNSILHDFLLIYSYASFAMTTKLAKPLTFSVNDIFIVESDLFFVAEFMGWTYHIIVIALGWTSFYPCCLIFLVFPAISEFGFGPLFTGSHVQFTALV